MDLPCQKEPNEDLQEVIPFFFLIYYLMYSYASLSS